MCSVEDCPRDVNRDGLCLMHKLKTVSMDTGEFTRERNGEDITQGRGTKAYVEDFYNRRRAAGLHDMEPENKKAAQYAPKMPIADRKKLRKMNNGL